MDRQPVQQTGLVQRLNAYQMMMEVSGVILKEWMPGFVTIYGNPTLPSS